MKVHTAHPGKEHILAIRCNCCYIEPDASTHNASDMHSHESHTRRYTDIHNIIHFEVKSHLAIPTIAWDLDVEYNDAWNVFDFAKQMLD